jgi:hypothetical protein
MYFPATEVWTVEDYKKLVMRHAARWTLDGRAFWERKWYRWAITPRYRQEVEQVKERILLVGEEAARTELDTLYAPKRTGWRARCLARASSGQGCARRTNSR